MTKRELRRLCEANNLKSPDILTAVVWPETRWDACRTAEIFLDITQYELPFSFDEWQRTVRVPTELYFVFERKRQLVAFIRRMTKELPTLRLLL